MNVENRTEAAQFSFLGIFFSNVWYSIFAVENFLAKHYSSQVGLGGYKVFNSDHNVKEPA